MKKAPGKMYNKMSRPAWARGLKHLEGSEADKNEEVAPCVGAWIETAR